MQIPTIHINGTSKDNLLKRIHTALTAIQKAERALTNTYPHPRDYITQPPTNINKAMAEHHQRLNYLRRIADELDKMYQEIDRQPAQPGTKPTLKIVENQ